MSRKLIALILAPMLGGMAFVGLVCGLLWVAGYPLTFDQALMAGAIYTAGWFVVLALDALSGRFGYFEKSP